MTDVVLFVVGFIWGVTTLALIHEVRRHRAFLRNAERLRQLREYHEWLRQVAEQQLAQVEGETFVSFQRRVARWQ